MNRRLDIDWLRGFAVLLMIMWHSIDSWTVETGRDSTAFFAIAFAAGWVAPLFLFLAGVSLPLAAEARVARGASREDASWSVQKRGWQVLLLAHLFRFQSFLLNPNGSWNGILKPDILNVLGLGIVAAAWCWQRMRPSIRSAVWWLLVPAIVIAAVITPLASVWWWPSLLHPRLEGYIRTVGGNAQFSLFPATAYIFAGVFLGSVLFSVRTDERPARMLAIGGAAALAGGLALGLTPWASSRWIVGFAIVTWRTGAMTLAVLATSRAFRGRPIDVENPLVVFGQTSLFVYWVHVELAYGVFSYPIRHSMTLPWSFLAYLAFAGLMLVCARLWRQRRKGPLVPSHMTVPA